LKGAKDKGFQTTGWDFLDGYINIHKKREKGTTDTSPTYIKDIVAGRPIFGHPSCSGGFRFRYGRSRVAGFSATSIHPATMGITNCFLSSGTQLKIEKPTKGCAITSCDSIEGPIVKFRNGSVRKIKTFEEAKRIYNEVEEIIYLGDILFPLGDVINRNYELLKPGYVEEWWELELRAKLKEANQEIKISKSDVGLEQAKELSKKYGIPLHPRYIFYWSQIKLEDFFWLLDWLIEMVFTEGKIVLPYSKSVRDKFKDAKRALELAGIEHDVVLDNVVIDEDAEALLENLGIKSRNLVDLKEEIEKIIRENKNRKNDFIHDCHIPTETTGAHGLTQ
jgi:DNA polymerase II large subunit